MDRRWRGQQGQNALQSLRSFFEYQDSLPVLSSDRRCAAAADVYSTYSCLHAAGRETKVLSSSGANLWYLQVLSNLDVWLEGFISIGHLFQDLSDNSPDI